MHEFERATRELIATMAVGHARQVRVRAERFAAYCERMDIDPLTASAPEWAMYVAAQRWTPTRAYKEKSAVRKVVAAAGQLTTEHGLGSGNQSSRLIGFDSSTIDAFLAAAYPERAPVARSALAKLATWCDEVGVGIHGVNGPDVDDFDDWLRTVMPTPGSGREIVVIARDWAEFLCSGSLRERDGRSHANVPRPR